MRKGLLILISFFTIVGCTKKDSADLSKENDLNKQKELIKALGFDLNKVTIHTDKASSKDSVLVFHTVEEAKNYFKKLNGPHRATCGDTLNMLSKSPKEFNNYFKSLIDRGKLNAKNNNRPQISTSSIDYSHYNGFHDEEAENWWEVWDDVELTAPNIDYDPTVDTWRWLNDYNNNVFSGHKGTARMKKWVMYVCYNVKFDWDFSANVELASNVEMWLSGLTFGGGQMKPHAGQGDFWCYPGSALIYFHTYGDIDFTLFVDGIGTWLTVPIGFNGWYNTNTGKYWIEDAITSNPLDI